MKRGGPLRRTGTLRRGVGLAPMSAKARAAIVDHDVVRRAVFDRDRRCLLDHLGWHRCFGPWTPHHVRKASAGGAYSETNLVTLCAHGNDWVETEPDRAWELGLVARRYDELHEVAQRRWLHGLVPR